VKRLSIYHALIKFTNTFSLLVALGTFSLYLYFSKRYDVQPNFIVGAGLSLGTWIIYTIDHLLDAIQLKEHASSTRHRYHFYKHRQIIFIVFISIFILLVLSLKLSRIYYTYVFCLSILTVIHFLMNYIISRRHLKLRLFKEIYIALVVTIGFVITPVLEHYSEINLPYIFGVFGVLYLINLANLFIFSYFDRLSDQKDKMLSIAHFYSPKKLKQFIQIGIGLSIFLTFILLVNGIISWIDGVVFLPMQLSLLLIIIKPSLFIINDQYRFYGDLIYLYPIITFPFLH